ncbi:MAG: ArsA family ATPase [Spirochaetaceae bacterium]
MKSLFFTGKGGVGKSTLASAAAWQLAQRGNKVLAISLDPAHNLGDIFGRSLDYKKRKIADTLWLQEADLDRAAQEYLQQNTELLTQVYSYTKAFNLDMYFKVLRHSPGVEEYASLLVLENAFRNETDMDYIVFDTPPTGLTLRILALPSISVTWINRLRKIRQDILRKRHTVYNITGKYSEEGTVLPYTEEEDPVFVKLQEMFKRYVSLYERLSDPENNHIAVVFNPDYLSLRESQRIISGLADLNLPLRIGFNNKYMEELSSVAEEVEGELFKGLDDVAVHRVPYEPFAREGAYKMDHDIITPMLDGAADSG